MALAQDYKHDLKVKAAYYYYKKDRKLADIAETLGVSRVTLNKLLQEAREEGIVRIDIIDRENVTGVLELEELAKERFGLKNIMIAQPVSNDYHDVARMAARMVDRMMFD